MKLGRPKKYKSAKALREAVEAYFGSISRTAPALDPDGEPICNDEGEVIWVTEYIVPPSVSGLCLRLQIDRSTWQNYCDHELHPEFAEVTAMTRQRIEAYLEEELLTRQKGVQGIIFNLQNNYGWKQKVEAELGRETRKAVSSGGMTMEEKLAVIALAQARAAGEETGERE